MIELWATDNPRSGFHLWVRHEGGTVDAEFEFPATVREAFGMLRQRGLDVEGLAVIRGNRIVRRRSMPNPKRRAA